MSLEFTYFAKNFGVPFTNVLVSLGDIVAGFEKTYQSSLYLVQKIAMAVDKKNRIEIFIWPVFSDSRTYIFSLANIF